jgi:hypothetical protein
VLSKIWNDEKFISLSEDAQRLFLYHLTSDRATPFLLYIEGPGAISDTLRMPSVRLSRAIKELSAKDMVWYADDGSNFVFLPKALKHPENAPESPNSVKTWLNLLTDLPKTPFYYKCLSHWLSLREGIGQGITHPLMCAFLKGLPTPKPTTNPIQEQEQEQEQDIIPPIPPTPQKVKYLRHVFLLDEEFQSMKEKLGEQLAADLIERLDGYIAQIGEKTASKKYVSHYDTMLNWHRNDQKKGGFNGSNGRAGSGQSGTQAGTGRGETKYPVDISE